MLRRRSGRVSITGRIARSIAALQQGRKNRSSADYSVPDRQMDSRM